MKGCVIALGKLNGHAAAARAVDGKLDDLLVDGPSDSAPGAGAVFRARCDRPVKGQGGMFVQLGGGLTGFLRQAKGLSPGQDILVQVTGHAEAGKAIPVTDRVLFKSRYCIVTPHAPGVNVARGIRDPDERGRLLEIAASALPDPGETGLILRSACNGADEDVVGRDLGDTWTLARRIMEDRGTGPERLLDAPDAHALAWRDWGDPVPDEVVEGDDAFERCGLGDLIDEIRHPLVALGAGGSMVIEPTRALIAVDVNTGADASPAAGLKANIAAARDLPRQLRCRGLGGQITIDFAPALKKDRRHIETVLKAAFRDDPVTTSLAGWTPLGHFELQRQRSRLPLTEALR